MAERVIHQLVDDISGVDISDGGGESIDFSVRGVHYRIDLSAANAAKFDKALKPYLEAATKTGGTRGVDRAASRDPRMGARQRFRCV